MCGLGGWEGKINLKIIDKRGRVTRISQRGKGGGGVFHWVLIKYKDTDSHVTALYS